ncbi:hypothetical protein TPHA_0E02480 [Tetrapisispora phaffii CBS 4417]|uniref:Increased recombination centers protein 6 n=1 Tax=Tetrapisispora phaffii (strain ATCC 24235 / CBS 4417 / NBRC 1672 / NRRL Y-8282 / UCD 70-5) TaxID=1071381 RepID=G8BTW2_TETPH|nr:hypothetical protein TPHA_0E02480 [Tetrapisispora phaffii CBS 4417]CCE63340.1 hypothetical protein TPHA_0E02480 [Tetrapisispora phaffii CBS 4417]
MRPRDKLLVLFSNDEEVTKIKSFILQKVFKLDNSILENGYNVSILKDLVWENKYYSLNYDLYVDEYDNIETWIKEYISKECDVLREVLSGIIIIDKFDNKTDTNELLSISKSLSVNKGSENIFNIFINTNMDFEDSKLEEINDSILASEFDHAIEFLKISYSDIDENISFVPMDNVTKYGERVGLSRAIDIIDTSDWEGCIRVMTKQKTSIKNKEIRQDNDNEEHNNLDLLLKQLHIAREQFNASQNKIEAEKLANDLAEEISKLI